MKKTIVLGKVDYEGKGDKNIVELEYSLEDGRFSASGGIWNYKKSDYITCGQILEEIAELFPNHNLAQRIIAVWRKYHLNDMKAGTPKQEAFLEKLNLSSTNYYETAKEKLADAGLEPDESFIYNGKSYSYGSAWLKEDLPSEIIAEIESWESISE